MGRRFQATPSAGCLASTLLLTAAAGMRDALTAALLRFALPWVAAFFRYRKLFLRLHCCCAFMEKSVTILLSYTSSSQAGPL